MEPLREPGAPEWTAEGAAAEHIRTGCWVLPGDRAALRRLHARHNSVIKPDHVTDDSDNSRKAGFGWTQSTPQSAGGTSWGVCTQRGS